MVARLYYWLDLNGPQGKPAHSKVLATATQAVLLLVNLVAAFRMEEVTFPYVALATATGALCFGLDGVKFLANLKATARA